MGERFEKLVQVAEVSYRDDGTEEDQLKAVRLEIIQAQKKLAETGTASGMSGTGAQAISHVVAALTAELETHRAAITHTLKTHAAARQTIKEVQTDREKLSALRYSCPSTTPAEQEWQENEREREAAQVLQTLQTRLLGHGMDLYKTPQVDPDREDGTVLPVSSGNTQGGGGPAGHHGSRPIPSGGRDPAGYSHGSLPPIISGNGTGLLPPGDEIPPDYHPDFLSPAAGSGSEYDPRNPNGYADVQDNQQEVTPEIRGVRSAQGISTPYRFPSPDGPVTDFLPHRPAIDSDIRTGHIPGGYNSGGGRLSGGGSIAGGAGIAGGVVGARVAGRLGGFGSSAGTSAGGLGSLGGSTGTGSGGSRRADMAGAGMASSAPAGGTANSSPRSGASPGAGARSGGISPGAARGSAGLGSAGLGTAGSGTAGSGTTGSAAGRAGMAPAMMGGGAGGTSRPQNKDRKRREYSLPRLPEDPELAKAVGQGTRAGSRATLKPMSLLPDEDEW